MQKSPISVLQELFQSRKITLGDYTLIDTTGADHCRTFTYQVIVNGEPYQASAPTKKDAKTACAQNALNAVVGEKNISNLQVQAMSFLPSASQSKTPVCQINYIGQLNEFQQTKRYEPATYQDEIPAGLAFCMKCLFAGFETSGMGSCKREAKQNAAKEMVKLLNEKKIGMNQLPITSTMPDVVYNIPDEYIIQRYKELSITLKEKETELIPSEQLEIMDKDVKIQSWSDLENELQNLGYKFSNPETLQTKPYVLFMTINKGTMMGAGDNRQEAINKLVKATAKMLKDGYRFNDAICYE